MHGTSQKKECGILRQSVGEKPFDIIFVEKKECGKVWQPCQKMEQV
jgi:hypothetical protein